MGKIETVNDSLSTKKAHITALTVDRRFRRQGCAKSLINAFESVSRMYFHVISSFVHCVNHPSQLLPESVNPKFVDLFVRMSNKGAIRLYTDCGYRRHNTIRGYYSGRDSDDALEMVKYI